MIYDKGTVGDRSGQMNQIQPLEYFTALFKFFILVF